MKGWCSRLPVAPGSALVCSLVCVSTPDHEPDINVPQGLRPGSSRARRPAKSRRLAFLFQYPARVAAEVNEFLA